MQQYIDDRLLDLQAQKESVSVDEVLKRHVSVNVQEPTEDQLRFYYEGVQTDEAYEIARPKIIETIEIRRRQRCEAPARSR